MLSFFLQFRIIICMKISDNLVPKNEILVFESYLHYYSENWTQAVGIEALDIS